MRYMVNPVLFCAWGLQSGQPYRLARNLMTCSLLIRLLIDLRKVH
jgi:hypothetical protein